MECSLLSVKSRDQGTETPLRLERLVGRIDPNSLERLKGKVKSVGPVRVPSDKARCGHHQHRDTDKSDYCAPYSDSVDAVAELPGRRAFGSSVFEVSCQALSQFHHVSYEPSTAVDLER